MSIVYLSLLGWVPLMMLLLVVLVLVMLVLLLLLLLLPAPTLLLECFSLPSSIYGVCVCYVSPVATTVPLQKGEAGCLTGPLAHNQGLDFRCRIV